MITRFAGAGTRESMVFCIQVLEASGTLERRGFFSFPVIFLPSQTIVSASRSGKAHL